MKKNKKEHYSSVENNLYMIKMLSQASVVRIPLEALFHISKGIIQTLIYTVLFGEIVNSLQRKTPYNTIVRYLIIILLITGIGVLYQIWFKELFLPINNTKIQKYMLNNIFMHSSELDIEQYEEPQFYDKYIRTLDEANKRAIKLSNTIASLCGLIATVIYLLYNIVKIDELTLIFVIIPLIPGWIFGKKKNKINYDLNIENTKYTRKTMYMNRIMYMKEYAKELRTTNIYPVLRKHFNDNMDHIIFNMKKSNIKSTALTICMDFMNDKVIYIGILLYITYKIVVKKELLIGDYLIVQNSVASATWRISTIINSGLELNQSGKFIGTLREFMETMPTRDVNESTLKESCSLIKGDIQVKNLCFAYSNNKEILKNVTVDIKKGSKIAIVGHNGAGKSTFIKLLMGLYTPTSGDILFNGKPIQNYDLDEYKSLYSTVFQDFNLYSMNIGENITMNEFSQKNEDEVKDALKSSDFIDRVMNLKDGVYTEVTKEFDNNGYVPSGGEGQKIALSRAIYQSSEVMILDEPSSALDPISEAHLNKLILDDSNEKTVIFISHRLSTCIYADEILLFEDGEIIERGSHEKLITDNEKYATMFITQMEKYDLTM